MGLLAVLFILASSASAEPFSTDWALSLDTSSVLSQRSFRLFVEGPPASAFIVQLVDADLQVIQRAPLVNQSFTGGDSLAILEFVVPEPGSYALLLFTGGVIRGNETTGDRTTFELTASLSFFARERAETPEEGQARARSFFAQRAYRDLVLFVRDLMNYVLFIAGAVLLLAVIQQRRLILAVVNKPDLGATNDWVRHLGERK